VMRFERNTRLLTDEKIYERATLTDSFVRAIACAMNQPADVDVNKILLGPTRQEC
jgi:NADP-dependent 3-hydroxy acid dehydrogenase YdfG